jgi:hypothetical protein
MMSDSAQVILAVSIAATLNSRRGVGRGID